MVPASIMFVHFGVGIMLFWLKIVDHHHYKVTDNCKLNMPCYRHSKCQQQFTSTFNLSIERFLLHKFIALVNIKTFSWIILAVFLKVCSTLIVIFKNILPLDIKKYMFLYLLYLVVIVLLLLLSVLQDSFSYLSLFFLFSLL